MEEYRSLYRKYRPQAPDQVLGQEHVIRALSGAVREGRLSHAFLFSGPRGTGKTSTARILAKMVNCERGPTPEPDGSCEQCVRIEAGTHLDVVEIDAASHGGVDDARELRERAPTAPAQGREKVYIIDEAQRLSREAFDALLKVFEEPPEGVRFVLATTEPHKMPATIVGRCQKFEFRRVPEDTIASHLATVAKEESIVLAPEAGELIARVSEGSVRDALSLLDQAAVLGGGEVTEEVVGSLVGAPAIDVQFDLADAVAVGDARGVFGVIHRLVQEGHDLRHFAVQATTHFRNLLLAHAAPEDPAIVDVPPEVHPRLAAQAGKFSPEELDRILSLLLQAQSDMRWTTSPRLTLELALVRAALPETDPRPQGLVARLERLERLAGLPTEGAGAAPAEDGTTGRGKAVGRSEERTVRRPTADERRDEAPRRTGAPEDTSGGPPERAGAPERDPAASAQGESHAPATGAVDAGMLRRDWPRVLETLRDRRKMVLYASAEVGTVGSFENDTLELVFPPGREVGARKVEERQADLVEVLRELFGITPGIRCTVREPTAVPTDEGEEAPDDPDVAARLIREQFGADVVED